MKKPAATTSPGRFLAETHEVTNVASELQDYNPYATDIALREGVAREGAAWADAELLCWSRTHKVSWATHSAARG